MLLRFLILYRVLSILFLIFIKSKLFSRRYLPVEINGAFIINNDYRLMILFHEFMEGNTSGSIARSRHFRECVFSNTTIVIPSAFR